MPVSRPVAFVDEVVVAVAEEHQVDEARRRSGTQPNFVWFATSQVDNHYENQRQGGWLRIDEVAEIGWSNFCPVLAVERRTYCDV